MTNGDEKEEKSARKYVRLLSVTLIVRVFFFFHAFYSYDSEDKNRERDWELWRVHLNKTKKLT